MPRQFLRQERAYFDMFLLSADSAHSGAAGATCGCMLDSYWDLTGCALPDAEGEAAARADAQVREATVEAYGMALSRVSTPCT